MLQVWHEAGVLASSLHRIFIEFNLNLCVVCFASRALSAMASPRGGAAGRGATKAVLRRPRASST